MEALIAALIDLLRALAYAAIIALCGYAYKRLRNWRSEHAALLEHLEKSEGMEDDVKDLKEAQEPQNAALREILGTMQDVEHKRLVKQGCASPDEKSAFERKYMAYHGLGGNGTRTGLYEDVMQMKSYPTE